MWQLCKMDRKCVAIRVCLRICTGFFLEPGHHFNIDANGGWGGQDGDIVKYNVL